MYQKNHANFAKPMYAANWNYSQTFQSEFHCLSCKVSCVQWRWISPFNGDEMKLASIFTSWDQRCQLWKLNMLCSHAFSLNLFLGWFLLARNSIASSGINESGNIRHEEEIALGDDFIISGIYFGLNFHLQTNFIHFMNFMKLIEKSNHFSLSNRSNMVHSER